MFATRKTRGFTLIASLMLMLIMSGVAIGVLMMVNTEGKVGGQDTQNNLAFHAAEGGIEHMTSDLANMFQNIESPTAAQIEALSADAPSSTNLMSYPVYTLIPATNPNGSLATNWGQIASGTYQGLYAQLLPVQLQVTATTSLFGAGTVGDEVNMSRTIEVALIPVFQFGVFSESDLSFFAGVPLTFAGRTHTNGDLYLDAGTGATTTFQDKVTAWGNVIRTQLANGNTSAGTNHLGTVDILTAAQGCNPPQPACRAIAQAEGSVVGGPVSAQNPGWTALSVGTYNSWIIDGNYGKPGGTGANLLSLPFINNALGAAGQPQPYEIIRRPPPGESSSGALGASRLYNEAEIRVLLSDTPADLPGGVADPNNIRLANPNVAGATYQYGVPASTPAGLPALASGGTYNTYFAAATTGYPDTSTWTNASLPLAAATTLTADWPYVPLQPIAADITFTNDQGPPAAPLTTPTADTNNNGLTVPPPALALTSCPGSPPVCPASPVPYYNAPYPYFTPPLPTATNTWNLIDGYLRVEYRDAGGAYHPITAEWLQLGFARGTLPPNSAAVPPITNPVNPNAILILQEPADRNGDGAIDQTGAGPSCSKSGGVWTCVKAKPPEVTLDLKTLYPWYGDSKAAVQSVSMNNWYPVNLYDAREGEVRDVQNGNASSCTPAGVMNAVEIDVGNLAKWLNGTIPGSGTLVDPIFQNGYVLYFSDRRGMLPNPNGTQVDAAGTKSGDSGLEDSVNSSTQVGNPDGALEPIPAGKTQSPEDVNNNGLLDNWGAGNLGLGLGYVPIPAGVAYPPATSVNSLVRNAAAGNPDPYLIAGRIPNCIVGQKNWVSGARHVLKLVDGSLGNLPVRLDNGQGGFTVASENPVYILGDYNSSAADPTWANPAAGDPAHAAAGVIADAVTMLSNNWSDLASLRSPSNDGGRIASTTYYRTAISGGKNINFPVNVCCAGWAVGDWGTDGGLHNFLRQLEDWTNAAGVQQTLNYKGSMASLYYSTYSTGTDKNGGGTTYEPPVRNYFFDPDFTQPQNLPPGTPLFRDIDNLSYRQSFTPHTGCY
jgi:type II secretory pathway pseudopilin PulG